MLKYLLALLLMTGNAIAQTGSAKTAAQLNTEVNTFWLDNGTGQITPFNARQTLLDMIASAGTVFGPGVSVVGHYVAWGSTDGTQVTDGGALAASATTDTTNATNITSGTLAAGRLPAFGSGDVSFAAAGGTGTIAGGAVTGAKIATNTITNSNFAQAGANTMAGNWTGSTANKSDNIMPACADSGGNHLNYVSGTGVTCGTSSAASAFVLLNTLTASNSATLADTTSLTATYSSYEIVFINVLPATASVSLVLQVHSGGSFPATSYINGAFRFDTGGTAVTTSTTNILIGGANANLANSGSGVSGKIIIYNPSQTTSPKMINGLTSGLLAAGPLGGVTVSGYWNGGNGAVDGFQVLMSSGNITSGVIKIYGIT